MAVTANDLSRKQVHINESYHGGIKGSFKLGTTTTTSRSMLTLLHPLA